MGFENLMQTSPENKSSVPPRAGVLLGSERSIEELQRLIAEGWEFSRTRITEKYSFSAYRDNLPEGGEPVLVRREDGELEFFTGGPKPLVEEGDQIVSFLPPEDVSTRTPREKKKKPAESAATNGEANGGTTPAPAPTPDTGTAS